VRLNRQPCDIGLLPGSWTLGQKQSRLVLGTLSSRGNTPADTLPRIASLPLWIFFVSMMVSDCGALLSPKRLELVTASRAPRSRTPDRPAHPVAEETESFRFAAKDVRLTKPRYRRIPLNARILAPAKAVSCAGVVSTERRNGRERSAVTARYASVSREKRLGNQQIVRRGESATPVMPAKRSLTSPFGDDPSSPQDRVSGILTRHRKVTSDVGSSDTIFLTCSKP
jgi:hypothetical protein